MKGLDRYTLTALWLADFLSESVRNIILEISNSTDLLGVDKLLDDFCHETQLSNSYVLCVNPAAYAKISEDCRMFGFAESELSRRLNIQDGEHTDKITVITWSYDVLVHYMLRNIDPADIKLQPKLTSKVYDKARLGFRYLVTSLIRNGCYASIGGKESKYCFFGASAGQMRKQRFVLLREDVYQEHNEALCLGLTEEKINDAGGILASKWLPYKMLCMSSGRKETWFDIDKVVVVPDRSINLTAVVDTVTTDYDVVRGERDDIENPINDGVGLYWRRVGGWKPKNKQIRYAFVKGLITPVNFLSLFRLYGKEPVITDLWKNKVNLLTSGTEVILTESQLKLNTAYFTSWEEYKDLCKKYNREFVVLNEDGGYVDEAEIPYQCIQDLFTATETELEGLASKSIDTMRSMLTPEGALEALRADKTNIHSTGFQKALNLLPELLGDAYTQEQLAMLYDNSYRTACGGKLESKGRYRYIVPDPIALFEACLLGITPKGVIKAGEVWQRDLISGHKVDILRSPHMYVTEHCIRTVAQYRKAFDFLDSDALYISILDLLYKQLQADFDGDIALVVDDPNLVATAEHCTKDTDAGVLYYDAQKAKKKLLNDEAIAEAIFNAADFNKIGIYSIYAVKLLASDNPDMKVLAMLAAAGNFSIDAVKTGAAIELPRSVEKALRKLDKPDWWKYAHQTADHPHSDEEYWDAELNKPGKGAIDRVGRIIRNSVPAKAELNVEVDPNLWAKMVVDPRRKTLIGVVDAFKDCARRNAAEWSEIFRKRPDLRENWEEAAVIAEKKLKAATAEIVAAAKGDVMAAYDTIARALFKYPAEIAFKRFFWSVFGDIAAEVIKSNLEKAEETAA